jgi:hypothetical protein
MGTRRQQSWAGNSSGMFVGSSGVNTELVPDPVYSGYNFLAGTIFHHFLAQVLDVGINGSLIAI